MTNVLDEVLAANRTYAADFGDKGKLAMPPAQRFAILTSGPLGPLLTNLVALEPLGP